MTINLTLQSGTNYFMDNATEDDLAVLMRLVEEGKGFFHLQDGVQTILVNVTAIEVVTIQRR